MAGMLRSGASPLSCMNDTQKAMEKKKNNPVVWSWGERLNIYWDLAPLVKLLAPIVTHPGNVWVTNCVPSKRVETLCTLSWAGGHRCPQRPKKASRREWPLSWYREVEGELEGLCEKWIYRSQTKESRGQEANHDQAHSQAQPRPSDPGLLLNLQGNGTVREGVTWLWPSSKENSCGGDF